MPSIFELWEDRKLERGVYVKIPIQEREITLPQIITGEEEQTVTTKDVLYDGQQLNSCVCVSTGVLCNHNSQLLLLGEVLPIPVTLTAYCGALNGSVAINLTCAALLSMPKQLISAKSINLELIKKYKKEINNLGPYYDEAYWVDDYIALTGKPGSSISCGLCYMSDKEEHISCLCENICGGTLEGKKVEKTVYRFGETYTNFIRPVFCVDVRNPALKMEFKKYAWVICTE